MNAPRIALQATPDAGETSTLAWVQPAHAAAQRALPLIAPRLRLNAERHILGAIMPGEDDRS